MCSCGFLEKGKNTKAYLYVQVQPRATDKGLSFFFFWLHWVFVATHGLSLVLASRVYSTLWCAGFSMQWLLLLQSITLGAWASAVAARGLSSCDSRALEQGLGSCGVWALGRTGFSSCGSRA